VALTKDFLQWYSNRQIY